MPQEWCVSYKDIERSTRIKLPTTQYFVKKKKKNGFPNFNRFDYCRTEFTNSECEIEKKKQIKPKKYYITDDDDLEILITRHKICPNSVLEELRTHNNIKEY